jgi:hypothetical protein
LAQKLRKEPAAEHQAKRFQHLAALNEASSQLRPEDNATGAEISLSQLAQRFESSAAANSLKDRYDHFWSGILIRTKFPDRNKNH